MKAKKTVRFLLAALDVLTSLGLVLLVWFLWTRSTLFVIGVCVQVALSLVSATGLITDRTWGRLLVRVASWYQLGLLVLLLLGILFGASYLWGLYGDVGTGAAVIFLVIGVLLIQVLGLLPVFKLRQVGIRESHGAGSRRWWLWTLGVVLLVALSLSLGTRSIFAYPAWKPMDEVQVAHITNRLVAVARGQTDPGPEPARTGSYEEPQDLFVLRIVSGGQTRHRAQARSEPESAGVRLAKTVPRKIREGSESVAVLLDRVVARGPILTGSPFFALSVVPGLDGFASTIDGNEALLLPQELIEKRLLTRDRPIPFVPDFRMGVRRADVERELCAKARKKRGCRVESLERIRTETWLACGDGRVLPLHRGRPPFPKVNRESASAAARAAGEYVLGSLGKDNRFVYIREPRSGGSRGQLSTLPRHAGPTWFLSQIYAATGDERFLEGARRGLSFLGSKLKARPAGRVYLPSGTHAGLGIQALTLIAFAEYAAVAEPDEETVGRIRGLSNALRAYQKEDGDFHYRWDLDADKPIPGKRQFYASGQAALALAKAARVLDDPGVMKSAREAMDFLSGPYWDFFLGGFFFLEEHWTCLAALEAWELFHDPKHAQLCVDIGRFTLQLQHKAGAAAPDFVGGVGFSTLFPPHTTPTASRAEALVAASTLASKLGEPDEDLRQGVEDAIGFLMHNQVRREEACLLAVPEKVIGSVGWNYLNPDIRIDTVQHAGSSILMGADLLD